MSKNFDPNQNYYFFNKKKSIPVVFIHGVGLDHQMWVKQVNYLNEFSILTYDLLGHGKTPFNKDKLSLKDFSDQLLGLLDYLKIEKINLVGFSLGSLIALDFSSRYQEKIDKLILIGTTYKRSDQERSLVLERYNQAKLNKPISKQALKRWFSDKYLENNPETYNLFINLLNKKPDDHKNFLKAYELFANHYDNFEDIKKIDRKTLVMTGSDDTGSTPAMSKDLVKDLVNSTYIEIQNGKHLCSIECADDVNINIKNFINN
ncbi:MAG: alpha/beta fold hydrolase [Pelagibacteraceae bacterium]|jgi:pimeloyl-ACP methyl ester carboxylesterase|nr:alpha/beta fold hydrolase [Pelagibacteraceae bacterium]MDC3391002.1 alpha/beta hydrolase [Candidatus Pelagibacter sp.]